MEARVTDRPNDTDRPIDAVGTTQRRWSELGMAKPEHFAAMSALLRASAILSGVIGRTLKPFKVSRRGLLVMIILFVSPDDGRPLGQISKILMVHPTTVTLTVDQLTAAGLVERRAHPTDRRTVLAALTPAGIETMTQIADALAAVDYGLIGTDADTAGDVYGALRRALAMMGDA